MTKKKNRKIVLDPKDFKFKVDKKKGKVRLSRDAYVDNAPEELTPDILDSVREYNDLFAAAFIQRGGELAHDNMGKNDQMVVSGKGNGMDYVLNVHPESPPLLIVTTPYNKTSHTGKAISVLTKMSKQKVN